MIIKPSEKKFQTEKEFQEWFSKSIKETYGEIAQHKLSDQAIIKKPCDYFFIDDEGRGNFCELKVIPGYTLPLSRFEPQQIEFLTMLASRFHGHCLPLVVVYSKKTQEVAYLRFQEIREELFEKGSVQIFKR